MVGASAEPSTTDVPAGTSSARRRRDSASLAAVSACITTAPTSGSRRPRIRTMPSPSGYTWRARLRCRARRLLRLGLAVHSSPPADDQLDTLCGAGPANGDESLFGLWRRDAREGLPQLG